MHRLTLVSGLFACILASACFDEDETEPDAGSCAELTYLNFGKALIDAKCVGCHGASGAGGVSLDSLDAIRSHASHIIEHAVELNPPAMPYMQSPLPLSDREKLRQWLDCGAP